ncbi:hypothetical protein V494_07995 [Pseudogymnoascus sp. VKM F-4513 (FW-928)]|nr:hypothetical protein V494_07995 [Pseudogymnoascus sp. VKM F-4513 (FW-928)]
MADQYQQQPYGGQPQYGGPPQPGYGGPQQGYGAPQPAYYPQQPMQQRRRRTADVFTDVSQHSAAVGSAARPANAVSSA